MFDNLYDTGVTPRAFRTVTSLGVGETLTKIAMRLCVCDAAFAASSDFVCVWSPVAVPVEVTRWSSDWSTVPCPAAKTASFIGTTGGLES